MLLVYSAPFPVLVIYFISSLVPAPPPLMCNCVCTDLPAAGLVNRAHLASCWECSQGGRLARAHTRVYIFLLFGDLSKKKKKKVWSFYQGLPQ